MHEVLNKKVIAIEYPRPEDTITSQSYTFRIAALPGAEYVEVSIDGYGWEPCRLSGGAWWYDWSGYRSGEHELVARMRLPGGQCYATEPRVCSVELMPGDRVQHGGRRHKFARRKAHPFAGRPELRKLMAKMYSVLAPNQQDILCQLTQLIAKEGVNIDSLCLETSGEVATLRFLLDDGDGLRGLLESQGYQVAEDGVFCLELRNRPGELEQLSRKLYEQENGIRYLYAAPQGRVTKVFFFVERPEDAAGIVLEFSQRLTAAEA